MNRLISIFMTLCHVVPTAKISGEGPAVHSYAKLYVVPKCKRPLELFTQHFQLVGVLDRPAPDGSEQCVLCH